MPVQFDWVSDGTRLGELLVSAQVLPQSAVGAALRDTSPERPLGRVLQDEGLVDAAAIKRALREQTERRLLALFALRSGRIEFHPAPADASSPATKDLAAVDALALIARGVFEHYDAARVLEEVPGLDSGVVKAGPALEKYRARFELGPRWDAVVASLLERPGTVGELTDRTGVDRLSALRVAYILCVCQMAVVEAPIAASDAAGLSRRIAALAELVRQGAPAHAVLGLDESATLDRIDAAVRELERLLDPRTHPEDFPTATREKVRQVQEALPSLAAAARDQRLVVLESSSRRLLKESQWARALPLVEELAAAHKGDPSLRAWLAWCRYQTSRKSERDAKLCLDALTRIVEADDDLAHAHYCRGLVLEDLGRTSPAIAAFERAAALDGSLLDAERRIRVLRASADKPERSKAGRSHVDASSVSMSAIRRGDRHPLLSGSWRKIWILTGVLLGLLVVAQIVLRLDF